ncbi:MAG TPA: DUF805 domain-containing protein [Sphingomicrobium sp.]
MNPNMTPVDWAKRPILEKYADFTGRASRPELWWYVLAVVVAFILVRIIESILGIGHMIFYSYGPLTILLWLATIVPSIAVGVRRLHDTNRSGWWILLPIVPYCLALVLGGAAMMGGAAAGGGVGMMAGAGIAGIFMLLAFAADILIIVFYCLPGTPGDNKYGPPPLGAGTVPAE